MDTRHALIRDLRSRRMGEAMNSTEKLFFDNFKKLNDQSHPILSYLLSGNPNEPIEVDEGEQIICEQMIQWLGTSCGMFFLEQVFEEIQYGFGEMIRDRMKNYNLDAMKIEQNAIEQTS